MGIGEGLIYALAGGAQGAGTAIQQNAQGEIKKQDALDTNRALLMQKEEIDQMRQARVAEILQTVKTRMPDATHPEGERDLTPQELAAAKAGALESKGMLGESEKYRLEENRLRDDAQRTREKAEEATWRQEGRDIERDRWTKEFEHRKRQDALSARREDRMAGEVETKRGTEKEKQGLIGGYLASKRKGNAEDAEIYRQELISRHGYDPSGTSDKLRYSKIEEVGPDGFTKVPAILDRQTGGVLSMEEAKQRGLKVSETGEVSAGKPAKADTKAAANLPAGVPEGSKQIGTSKGKPVYLTPQGKRVIVD